MSKSLIAMLRGASRGRAAFRGRLAQVQNLSAQTLESKAMLSGVTFSVNASGFLNVNGTNAGESLTVQDNGTTVEIDCDGTIIDTGVSEGSLNGIVLSGRGGDDTLTIDNSIDPSLKTQINGNDGNDTLNGNDGDNTLRGGAGDDQYNGGDGDDRLNVGGDDSSISGGDGYDRVTFVGDDGGTNGLNITSSDIEYVSGSDNDDTIDLSGQSVNTIILGRGGEDTLTGGSGNDTLRGGDGDDDLSGGDGNDNLLGEAGADDLDGGDGSDRAAYNSSSAGVEVDLEAGTGVGGDADGDTFSSIENLTGSPFDDVLRGDDNDNVIFGINGDDLLEGRGGSDRLGGSSGNDTISYESSPSGVRVDLAARAYSGGDATGDNNIGGVENIIGSEFGDTLGGNAADNVIDGLAGNDFIGGEGGEDTLSGGDGNDTINGGLDADTIDAGDGNDVVRADQADFDSGSVDAGAGSDRLILQATGGTGVNVMVAGTNAEQIDGTNFDDTIDATGAIISLLIGGFGGNDTITGGDADDVLNGGNGNDIIGGGLGRDLIRGQGGDDMLSGNELPPTNTADGEVDRLIGGGGTDTAYNSTDPENISGDTENIV